jgi:xanthine dehydrogenase accessory factor
MKNIYLQIIDQYSDYSNLVLATVTKSSGSTPQKPGSSALFGERGLLSGTVGGGIVEGKIQKLAAECIVSKNSGLFHFNLANDISKTEEAICGGEVSVLLDANVSSSAKVFEQLRNSLESRLPGVIITMVTMFSGSIATVDRYWMNESLTPTIEDKFIGKLKPLVKQLLTDRNPAAYAEMEIAIEGEEQAFLFFLEPVFPREHLVIAGAGHIGRALAHLGRLLDFEVTIIDDRPEYANSENIPDADHIVVKDIGEAMKEVSKGKDTFAVIVTRGHKDDASALRPCIDAGLAYTGMIGSRNKIASMKQKFLSSGWATLEQWNEIYAPVGMDIKSQTVEEIAVSIAAELILVRNTGRQYRGTK